MRLLTKLPLSLPSLSLTHTHSNTLASLVEESGCPLEHPRAATFRAHVIAGEWDEVSAIKSGICTVSRVDDNNLAMYSTILVWDSVE